MLSKLRLCSNFSHTNTSIYTFKNWRWSEGLAPVTPPPLLGTLMFLIDMLTSNADIGHRYATNCLFYIWHYFKVCNDLTVSSFCCVVINFVYYGSYLDVAKEKWHNHLGNSLLHFACSDCVQTYFRVIIHDYASRTDFRFNHQKRRRAQLSMGGGRGICTVRYVTTDHRNEIYRQERGRHHGKKSTE